MEDILNKDIFIDKDLEKLSPDYSPSHIVLRMQERRSLTKNMHSHAHQGFIKNILSDSRKTSKRTRDGSIINKEIAKIRNGFNDMNIKNRVMLKNAVKKIESLKNIQEGDNNSKKDILENDDLDINEITQSLKDANLVVNNDNDFKINDFNDKPNLTKLKNKVDIKKNYTKAPPPHNTKKNRDEDLFEILRVECKLNKKFQIESESIKSINESTEIVNEFEIDQRKDNKGIENNLNESLGLATSSYINYQIEDLQKLLVMMSISPKSNYKPDIENTEICTNTKVEVDILCDSNKKEYRTSTVEHRGESISQILNIVPMKVEIGYRQKYIMTKYFQTWRNRVKNQKSYVSEERQKALDNFFDKLAKKKMNQSQDPTVKSKMLAHDFSTYQHRYKVQKHIIALQKAKLDEQNRVIEELRYNKIVEASRQSVEAMREEIRKTYYEVDRHLKPKLKCLANELQIHQIEEPSLVLHCLKVPQFLQRMEKRAREREEKHAMIRERRKQMEEDRIKMKQQAELAKAEMDKEEKNKRIKELREKRKKEKIENIRKKQYADRMRALIVMADIHYEKTLKIKYGLRPFILLMELRNDNIEKAICHYTFQLKKNVFLHWMWHAEDMCFERNYKAEDFYRKTMLRKVFDGFKKNHYEYVLKMQVAQDYYDLYLTQCTFRRFKDGISQIRKENEEKCQRVVNYHNSNLLFKAFTFWRTLPALNALQREQEARKARWREKVLQVVPDYTPPED